MPKLATYISNLSQIPLALDAGADELILEDSKFSARSYSDDFSQSGFDTLAQYAEAIRAHTPTAILSVNLDILIHDRHFGMVYDVLKVMKQLAITKIRIQDPGLIPLIKEHAPQIQIVLGTETGNANSHSVQAYAGYTTAQHLSNELPHTAISTLKESVTTHFDLQVHGPILIQYANRRFMTGQALTRGETEADESNAPIIQKHAQAQEYPGRLFPFLDNPHGHFMFLYFDRCLIKSLPDLLALELDTWIIDGRGEAPDYAPTALSVYRKAIQSYQEDPQSWSSATYYEQLQAVAKRPLRPGFFKINRTDYMPRRHPITPEGYTCVGRIIDTVKGHNITIETFDTIQATDHLLAVTPNHKEKEFTAEKLASPEGHPLPATPANQMVCLGWVKAMVPKTLIFRRNQN